MGSFQRLNAQRVIELQISVDSVQSQHRCAVDQSGTCSSRQICTRVSPLPMRSQIFSNSSSLYVCSVCPSRFLTQHLFQVQLSVDITIAVPMESDAPPSRRALSPWGYKGVEHTPDSRPIASRSQAIAPHFLPP